MAKREIDWKMEHQFQQDSIHEVHGHSLGLSFYIGHDANSDKKIKTARLIVTEKDIHGNVKPYRTKNFETQKAENLQIVLPEDLVFVKKLSKFLNDAVVNARSEQKAQLDELKAKVEKGKASA